MIYIKIFQDKNEYKIWYYKPTEIRLKKEILKIDLINFKIWNNLNKQMNQLTKK